MEHTRAIRFVHVTGETPAPRPHFAKALDYRGFINTLRDALDDGRVRLLAYAILPNQWRLVAGSADPAATLELLARVARTQATRIEGRAPSVSRPVALEPLYAASAVVARCREVERRAVELGLVVRAQDWPWCSASERFFMLERLPLVSSRFLTSSRWLDYVNEPPELAGGRQGPLEHLAKVPGGLARLTERRQQRVGLARTGNEDQAHAHVEGAKHLGLRHASGLP